MPRTTKGTRRSRRIYKKKVKSKKGQKRKNKNKKGHIKN